MNKSIVWGTVLALTALTGVGGATVASARDLRARDFAGVWHLDRRYGDASQRWNDRGGYDRGRGGYDQAPGRYDQDWRGRSGDSRGYGSADFATLPSVIRIERERRELRVETAQGRLLREIETRRNGRDGRVQVETSGFGRTRITEVFSLQNGGRVLVVHTTVDGPRGDREFTSVYQRA